MERNRHILAYNADFFSLEKLEQSVAFLKDATGFAPDMMILDGTPRFKTTEQWEIDGVRKLATEQQVPRLWTSANMHREGQETDERSVPAGSVPLRQGPGRDCPPVSRRVSTSSVKITKEHGNSQEVAQVRMELDPATMLLRWV